MNSPKRVLVTGAAGCLGSIVCDRFLRAGFHVTGTDRHPPTLSSFPSDSFQFLKLDLSHPKAVKSALSSREFDILVHCAGGFRFTKADQVTDEDLEFLLNGNLRSAFNLTREIIPGMKNRNFGRIIFISSRATSQPGLGMGAYAASKAGLNMLTSSLAEELKPFDINVNALLPTVIDTPTNRKDMPQADFKQWVKPEQLAEIIFSLCSSLGDPIHGALIPVAGRV